jgi:hypothetical protein
MGVSIGPGLKVLKEVPDQRQRLLHRRLFLRERYRRPGRLIV